MPLADIAAVIISCGGKSMVDADGQY